MTEGAPSRDIDNDRPRRISKDDISWPENFRHLGHIGSDGSSGIDSLVRVAKISECSERDDNEIGPDIGHPKNVQRVLSIKKKAGNTIEVKAINDDAIKTHVDIIVMAQTIERTKRNNDNLRRPSESESD